MKEKKRTGGFFNITKNTFTILINIESIRLLKLLSSTEIRATHNNEEDDS